MTYKEIVRKIHSRFKVTIYRGNLMTDCEDVLVIIHHFIERDDLISVRIEFGRRFRDIIVYKEDVESLENMQSRFAVEFEEWINATDQLTQCRLV